MLDRGRGIFHCRLEFIKFLSAMEVVVNAEMIRGNEAAMKAGFNEKLAFEVHQDEDVLFWWSNQPTVFPRIVSAESILFRSCPLRLLNEGGY